LPDLRDDIDVQDPPAPGATSEHWMVKIAARAGLVGDVAIDLPASAPAADGWKFLTESVGIPETEVAELVAEYFRLDVADLSSSDPAALIAVPEAMARRFGVFPISQEDRQLVVATCNPMDVEAERALGFTSGRSVRFQVAPPALVGQAIDSRYEPDEFLDEFLTEELVGDAKSNRNDKRESISVEDIHATPVVKLTNLILRDAIRQGASDIHIEPGDKEGQVRYRIDGVLRKHMNLPMVALARVVSRIKIRSDMDIADRLRPQDGRTRVNVDRKLYDLRVSTIPAGRAEKCVIRILDQNESTTLEELGVASHELVRIRRLLSNRAGIVMVTGPTGSGKTTTLYAALREIADGDVNVMTVEDPIEYWLPTVTQTQVEVKQGMTFGSALRAILRQDPDVILVGEIRDEETARVAAQAAMTGHLVLATVHANNAVGAIPRLADLGLEYGIIGDTIRGSIAQRLLRKVCPDCCEKVDGDLTPEEESLAKQYDVRPKVRAVGCSHCLHSGYRGRIPILEVMEAGPSMEEAIAKRKGVATLQTLAVRGGMRTLRDVALDWVQEGSTTLVEVERVVGASKEDGAASGPDKADDPDVPSRILVVDDDESTRLQQRTLLEVDGYEVTEAVDGEEALKILREDPDFSLVILDLAMPGLDGRDVLRAVRDDISTHAMPVMISTGDDSETTESELLEAGADDYLEKSAKPTRFLARVRSVLRRAVL